MKTKTCLREEMCAQFGDEELLFADGFDGAIIGVDWNGRVVYNIEQMVNIMIVDGSTPEDAIEYLEFNTFCAYVGEKTPIFVYVNT